MQAAKVDTLSVHSDAMNKEVQVITICPDKAMGFGGGGPSSGFAPPGPYMEEEFGHKPTDEEIRTLVMSWYNSQTRSEEHTS